MNWATWPTGAQKRDWKWARGWDIKSSSFWAIVFARCRRLSISFDSSASMSIHVFSVPVMSFLSCPSISLSFPFHFLSCHLKSEVPPNPKTILSSCKNLNWPSRKFKKQHKNKKKLVFLFLFLSMVVPRRKADAVFFGGLFWILAMSAKKTDGEGFFLFLTSKHFRNSKIRPFNFLEVLGFWKFWGSGS